MVVLPPSFVFPPTDGSIPPALAIDFHHRNNPRHIFAILYHAGEPSQSITYEQLAYAVHRVAYTLNPDNKIPQGTNIGLLISASSLEYIVLFLGAMRAGLVPFPISPRVHLPGIAHLLTTTKTSLVVTGGSDAIYNTTAQLAEILESNFEVEFVKLSALRDTLSFTADESSETRFKSFPALETMGYNSIVTILHSSGSTGMPKAIKCHLEGVFKNVINQPLLWTLSEPNSIVGTMTLPTFHCMGLNLQVLAPLYTGYTQVLFAPSRIPAVPTPTSTLEAITSISCTFLICVPVFLEAWAHDEEAIAVLKSIKRVIFGGGPLTDEIGNKLIDRGIRMFSGYGATEFGIVTLAPDDHAKDWPWNYLKFSPHLKTHFIPQNDQDNAFELVFEAGEDHSPFVLNSELNGKAVYRTRDLLVPHPTKSNVWKFVGRVDDQIVLLNGEKTNPGPMEAEIVKCPLVRGAIMFGQARNQTGALIELKESPSGSTFDIEDDRRELIGALWPYIESANRTSSTHSRLDKRALIFVDPSRPLPRTPKGTIPRAAAWKLYANEIDAMYAALEQNIDADALPEFQPPETWADPVVVSAWITERAEDILGWDVDPTADLFQQGMDSLTATMLLRSLKQALHGSENPNAQSCGEVLTRMVVFENPTVRQLASLVVQHILRPNELNDRTQTALEGIKHMIQKYDLRWPQLTTNQLAPHSDMLRERVVVTGTTGALGSHLLAKLLANDRVERVWALNRKSREATRNRQRASFEDKMLDVALLKSHKLVFVDAALDDANLGLDYSLYDEIRSTTTIIIHNAWQVNFNLTLQSFEPNIRGTRNLLDLAFSSTAPTGLPRFAFASSISVAGFSGLGRQLDETSVQPEDAASSIGYGQSKLVAEKLLESARQAGLQTCIVRLGQLTGDINSGSWNTTDWVPSIIASSKSVGCLPAAAGTVSWLPLDVAACSIIDACTTYDEQIPPVIHASHPRPVPWSDVMSAFSAVLSSRTGSVLPVVEFGEWNKRVVESAAAFQGPDADRYKRFPSTKIQSTMDGMAYADQLLRSEGGDEGAESGGTVRLVTTRAEQASEGLRITPILGREHVEKWVKYWEAKGLLS